MPLSSDPLFNLYIPSVSFSLSSPLEQLHPKMHLVLSACPISHLSAHTFFNSAAHSLIIHQSIYTFFYPSSRSPSLFFSLTVLSPLSFLWSSPACLLWALQAWLSQSTKQCVIVYHPALKIAMKLFTAHQTCRPSMFYTFSGPNSDFIHFTVN